MMTTNNRRPRRRAPAFAWGCGDSLFVANSTPARSPGRVHILGESPTHTRRLFSEAHRVFVDLQDIEDNDVDGRRRNVIKKTSKQYHKLILSCVSDLHDDIIAPHTSDKDRAEMISQKELYTIGGAAWHLCQIMFLDSSAHITADMVEWWQYQARDALDEKLKDYQGDGWVLRDADHYWDCVFKLTLQGRFDETASLLSRHPELANADEEFKNQHPVGQLERCVRLAGENALNLKKTRSGTGAIDMAVVLKFRNDIQNIATEREDLRLDPRYLYMLCILFGEPAVLLELCDTWQEYLVAQILFVAPNLKKHELKYQAVEWRAHFLEEKQAISPSEIHDRLILAIMDLDLIEVLRIAELLIGKWFVAHLADLMYHARKLSPQEPSGPNWEGGGPAELRELFLYEYAASLLSTPSLWRLVLDYMSHCATYGLAGMETVLDHQAPGYDKQAHKLGNACQKFGLHYDISRRINTVVAMRYLWHGRYGAALLWLLRAHDQKRISSITQNLLSMDDTNLHDMQAIADTLGAESLGADRIPSKLSFFTDYTKWLTFLEKGERNQASRMLLQLVGNKKAPQRLWIDILYNAVPLIDSLPLVFAVDDIFSLMESVENCCLTHRRHDSTTATEQISEFDRKIQFVSMALSRTLSRAYMTV